MDAEKPRDYRGWLHKYYEEKRYEDALQVVLAEEKNNPDVYEVLQAKTSLLGLLDRHKEAVEAANSAIAIRADDHVVHHMKGVSLYYLGRHREAIEAFDVCLAIRPNFYRSIERKVSSLILLGKYEEAASLYENSDLPALYGDITQNNLGCMYVTVGQYEKASSYLYFAKRLNPLLPAVYYNLARLYWRTKDYVRFAKHSIAFCTLTALDKLIILKPIEKRLVRKEFPSGDPFYDGSGLLFQSDSQVRELRSILKLLRGINAPALCNDTWQWFAVNIPYEAVSKNGVLGDIDIILKRPRFIPGSDYDAGFTYRGFQVKTILVDRYGNIKSAKRGSKQHRKIKKQLNILKTFGCEQIFLLEIYVLERGYSNGNTFPSRDIAMEIREKAQFLQGLGFGYVVTAEEPSYTHDDESGGIGHILMNILPAVSNPIGVKFQELVDGIDSFIADPTTSDMIEESSQNPQLRNHSHISYCLGCKQLTMLVPLKHNHHVCCRCQMPIY